MPYNTRRKSICLPALGIQLPNSQPSRAHRPSLSKSSNNGESPPAHPAKRVKRTHSSASPVPESPLQTPPSAASVTCKTVTFADRPKSSGRNAYEDTPPPSPGAAADTKIDMENIKDDIVAGVIEQLEKTGNRPHLIKELASVLATTHAGVNKYVTAELRILQTGSLTCLLSSANPSALLSSRLATYMRRPWTYERPCPVAKELIPVHPRKVFYYLTTSPRQEIPASAMEMPPPIIGGRGKEGHKRIISPSLSNASQDEDSASNFEERKRDALSPSPEVDLSLDLDEIVYSATAEAAPDFPTPPTPSPSSYSLSRSSTGRDSLDSERELGLNHRSQPEMEGDEQEFTATARGMRMKGISTEDTTMTDSETITVKVEKSVESSETEDPKANPTEDAATLSLAHVQAQKQDAMLLSSPLVKAAGASPQNRQGPPSTANKASKDVDVDMLEPSIMGQSGFGLGWDIRRPQSVGLDELDDLFDTY